ncbi:TMEM135 C rich domain-containing protein [Citrus sinensis]|nr:TMEM135 C rich domain-containing protein [Citrus sinensis]
MLPAAGDAAASSVGFCSCFSVENGGSYDDYIDGSGNRGCMHCKRSDPSSSSSCYSCSSLWLDLAPFKDSEKLRRVITASAKGFSIGAGLKGGLALFSILTRLRRRQSSASSRKIEDFSNKEAITMAIKETIRYGLFLGTFAGPSMLLTGPNTQHTSLAIYILMRAAVLASRCGINSKRFGRICKPLTWKHGDLFLMCLSSSQILSAYILKQESLPPSYKSFLNKHGGKDAVILQGVKEIASCLPFSNLEAIEKFYKTMGVDIKLDPEMRVPCSIVHGNQGCLTHVVSFFIQAYKRALPVYLPVYLIPALIVHRKGLLERPYTILGKGLLGTTRSSLFLSVYCSSAWMWTCFLFRIFEKCNIPMVAMGTPTTVQFPTGLSLAIEKKSRRMEISLYCLARAIESFCTCLADIGYLPQSKNLKRADVVIFSLSTAIIMHCYAQEREVFRSKYLNVLDWVFGVPPPPCETPRCKSS